MSGGEPRACDVCARTADLREVPGFGCPVLCTPCRILFAPLWTMEPSDVNWWRPTDASVPE